MNHGIIAHLTAKGFDCTGFDDRLFTSYQQAKGLFGYFSFEDRPGFAVRPHIDTLFTEAPEQHSFAGRTGFLGRGYSQELEGPVFRLVLDYPLHDPDKSFAAIYDFLALPALGKCEALAKLLNWRSSLTEDVEANRKSFEAALMNMLGGLL